MGPLFRTEAAFRAPPRPVAFGQPVGRREDMQIVRKSRLRSLLQKGALRAGRAKGCRKPNDGTGKG